MIDRGPKWRAPKKTNNSAWKRVEAGDWLWELPRFLPRFNYYRTVKGRLTRNI